MRFRRIPIMALPMSNDAEVYRQRALEQRQEAEAANLPNLPNLRARALHAAERWDTMADQAERSSAATLRRDVEKAIRDARREPPAPASPPRDSSQG
jgi:hypothetical protein